VQEAWVRAVSALEKFRGESSVVSWLRGIVTRCAWERSRQRRRLDPLPSDDALEQPPAADHTDLGRALGALPPGCREVLVLHDLEGYTHPEIGRLLDIDAGTSKSQLHRARRLLRARLGSSEET
jgi:RNA polymerase sigma-70 factor (ECF subfamily)